MWSRDHLHARYITYVRVRRQRRNEFSSREKLKKEKGMEKEKGKTLSGTTASGTLLTRITSCFFIGYDIQEYIWKECICTNVAYRLLVANVKRDPKASVAFFPWIFCEKNEYIRAI